MSRYWRVYRTFFINSFARELEFRANFFAKILQNLSWVCFFLLVIVVIYSNSSDVAGWSRADAFVLSSCSFLMSSVFTALFFSLIDIPQMVRQGTLDFVLTKPLDSQFWVSTRRFNFNEIGMVLSSFGFLAVGLVQNHMTPSFAQWASWFVLMICAIAIYYSFNLLLMSLGIWFVRVDNLWALAETTMWVARYPTDIYSAMFQRLFLFVIPLTFMATAPAKMLVKGFDGYLLLLGIIWAVGFSLFARWVWFRALRDYSSASS